MTSPALKANTLHPAVAAFRKNSIDSRAIANVLPQALYVVDSQGMIVYWNKAAETLFGHVPEVGMHWTGLKWRRFDEAGDPYCDFSHPLAITLRERIAVHTSDAIKAVRPDGSIVWFNPQPTPLFDKDRNFIGAVNLLIDMTKEREHEEHLQALTKETIHRANNLLAIISTLIHNTQGTDVKSFRETLDARVRNLALVNQALVASEWRDVTNYQIVHMSLRVYGPKRYKVTGDVHLLDARAAQAGSMMVHELATNSAKHGALSSKKGCVEIQFYTTEDRAGFRWIETGGPKVQAPEDSGLGLKVIQSSPRQFGGTTVIEWRPEGLYVDSYAKVSKSVKLAGPNDVEQVQCISSVACGDCQQPCHS